MNHDRLQYKQNFRKYQGLITSPISLGSLSTGIASSAVTLPANAWIGVSSASTSTTGQLVCDVNGRIIGVKGGDANFVFKLGYLTQANLVKVKPLSGLGSGTIKLHVFDEWFRPFVIAQGTL